MTEALIENYYRPTTLEEAADILAGEECTILASGTDLMPQAEAGAVAFKPGLLNIRAIEGLRAIEDEGDHVRLGALTTITDLMDSELIQEKFPALWEACDHFASYQIRNAATVGGNVCNASPAGDTLVPYLVYDAEIELISKPNGKMNTRQVPLADFLEGPGKTARADNELLTAVILKKPGETFISDFFKYGTRPALDISVISIAIGGDIKDGDKLENVRVALGAVAPTAVRAPKTEKALEGRVLDADGLEEVATVAADEIAPIDDVRGTAWFRKEMVHNMLKRMLAHVID